MTDFEHDIKLAMRDVAEGDVRPGFAEELSTTLRKPQRSSAKRTYVLSAVAGVAAATVIIATINGMSRDQTPRQAAEPPPTTFPAYNGVGVVGPGEPCPNAVHSPLTNLAAAAKQPIWLPSKLPSAVTDAWSCGRGSAPVLMFGNVQVSYEPGWANVDLDQKWADYIAEDGGYTTTVGGRTALVHEATDAAPNNEVMLVKGDTLIRLLSVRTVPITKLVNLAKSFDLATPAVPAP